MRNGVEVDHLGPPGRRALPVPEAVVLELYPVTGLGPAPEEDAAGPVVVLPDLVGPDGLEPPSPGGRGPARVEQEPARDQATVSLEDDKTVPLLDDSPELDRVQSVLGDVTCQPQDVLTVPLKQPGKGFRLRGYATPHTWVEQVQVESGDRVRVLLVSRHLRSFLAAQSAKPWASAMDLKAQAYSRCPHQRTTTGTTRRRCPAVWSHWWATSFQSSEK